MRNSTVGGCIILSTFALAISVHAQPSLGLSSSSGGAAGTVSLNLSVGSTAGADLAGVQWSLSYPASNVTGLSIAAGPAAIAAGKSIACSSGINSYICIASGINSNAITDGTLATISVSLAPGAGPTVIGLFNALGSSNAANQVTITTPGNSVNIVPSATVVALGCGLSLLPVNSATTCTVTLNQPAAQGGTVVTLSSALTALSMPASVTVPAGSTTATFQMAAGLFQSVLNGSISASLNNSSQSFAVSLNNGISSLSCLPTNLTPGASGICTITLAQGAPTGGAIIMLTSNNSAVTVPHEVIVTRGATVVRFGAVAQLFTSAQSASITATWGVSSLTAILPMGLLSSPSLYTLVCDTPTLSPGTTDTCYLFLTNTAFEDTSITLISSNNAATVPPSVNISAGAYNASFQVTASPRFAGTTIISTTLEGVTQSATLSAPANTQTQSLSQSVSQSIGRSIAQPMRRPQPIALACNPTAISGGGRTICEVRLDSPSPSDATHFFLTSTSAHLRMPPLSGARAGQTKFRFEVEADAQSDQEFAVLSVKSEIGEVAGTLIVLPAASDLLADPPPSGSQRTPAIRTFENGAHASALAACAPGSVASLRGSSLTMGQVPGIVRINGELASVVHSSEDRLDFVCPQLPVGTALQISVETADGRFDTIHATMQAAAPGLFVADGSASDQAMAIRAGSSELASLASARHNGRPVLAGETLLVRATGIDCTSPDSAQRIQIKFDGTYALVAATHPAESAGQCEVTVTVPSGVAGDSVPLTLQTRRGDGTSAGSNTVFVAVEQR